MFGQVIVDGDQVDAAAGQRLGLFAEVVEPAGVMSAARAAAMRVVSASDRSVRISKIALRHGTEMQFSANLEVEAYLQSYAFRTPEHKQRIGEYRDRLGKKGS